MAIQVFCECGTSLSVKPELAGKKVKCKTCGTVLKIPALGEAPAEPAPKAAEPKKAEAEEYKPDYEVVKEGEKQVTCPACGAFCAPTDAACLACGTELEGGGGAGLLGKVPRPVLFGLIALIGFGGIGLAVRAAWMSSRPAAYAREGFDRFKGGDHAEARRAFEQALTYDPTFRDAVIGLAEVGVATGDERLVTAWSAKALDLLDAPDEPLRRAPIRIALARIKLAQDDPKTARNQAIDARDEDPNLAGVARGIIGLAALKSNQPEEALVELRFAAQARTEDWVVLNELVKLLVSRSQWDEASTAAEQCVRLEKGKPEVWMALARLRLRKDDRAGGKAALLEVIKLEERSADAHAMLSGVHLADNQLDAAFEAAKKAVDIAPDDASTHLAFGRVMLAQERPKAALEELEKAATKGGGWEAEFLLGKALLLTKDVQNGLRRMSNALAQRPDDLPLHLEAARALIAAGSGSGAVGVLSKVVSKHDDDYELHLLYAQGFMAQEGGRSRHDRDIQTHLRRAIDIDKGKREAPLALGRHLFDKGDVEDSIAVFSEALGRLAQDKDLLYWKGRACIRARRWGDAIQALDALKAIDANFEDVSVQLKLAQDGQFYEQNR